MPAWSSEWTGLKTVMVKSDNAAAGLPTIQANYLLIDNATGETVALMDGTELTRRRTAAASALAADYLAAQACGAHGCRRRRAHWPCISSAPTRRSGRSGRCRCYNRSLQKAKRLAEELQSAGFEARAASPISKPRCARPTSSPASRPRRHRSSRAPGSRPGTHVDLAGAFKPTMRETDGDVVARARVYVDTREGAMAEAGDLLQARDEGKFDFGSVQGDCPSFARAR